MNKFLLATMALALASGPACAQLQWEPVAPVAKKSTKFAQSNLKLQGKLDLSKKATRAGETVVPLDAKTLSNMPGWDRQVYPAKLGAQSGMTLKVATFFDPVLYARFHGNTLKKIRTVIGPNAKDLSAFIISAVTGEVVWEGKTLPAINNTTSKSKEIEFKCDYPLDKSEPLYVGYQFTAKSSAVELSMVNNLVPDGCLVDIVDEEEGFGNLSYEDGTPAVAYIDCITEGEAGLKDNDVVLLGVAGGRVPSGKEYRTMASFINYGIKPVAKLAVNYNLNGKEVANEVAGEEGLPFMFPAQFEIQDMSPEEAGRFLQNLTVSTVNGVEDEYAEDGVFSGKPDNVAQNYLTSISNSYPRKVVMEQFTGTWCGWCPRGHVAMEKAAKAFPNDFIGIAVHAGDEMMSEDYMPLLGMVGNFPSAMLNRIGYSLMDPYYGTQGPATQAGQTSGDILNDIAAVSKSLCEAKMDLNSKLNGLNIDVESVMDFTLSAGGAHYSVAYALLQDGIKGAQANYYNKDFQAENGGIQSADQIPEEDLRFLFDLGKKGKYQATFNNVAVAIKDAAGIAGSLDDVEIKTGQKVSHKYSIPVPAAITNKEDLEVVALLIDNVSGEIVTAAKCKVGEATTGVEDVLSDKAELVVADGVIQVNGNGVAALYSVDGKLVKKIAVNGSAVLSAEGLQGTYVVRVVNGSNVTVKKVML